MILLVAWRSFLRQLHRFQVIGGGMIFGVGAIVVLVGLSSGMSAVLNTKAARYFAGDVSIISLLPDRSIVQEARIRKLIESIPGFQSLCRRTEYYGGDTTLYFGGDSIRQRKLVGVDWTVEADSFRSLDWLSGGPLTPGDKKGILLSRATAERLHLQLGDEVVVSFRTTRGQGNSLTLIVRGVFSDTSFFGYASYVDIEALNAALGYRPGMATSLGALLNPLVSASTAGARLVELLAPVIPTYRLIRDRAEQKKVMEARPIGVVLAVTTLEANLAEINDILKALLGVATLASGLFLLILMIGVGNTYRMIVFERTQEIGTMRALGATRARIVVLLLAEAGVLGIAGLVLGGAAGWLSLQLLSLIDWSGNSLAALFLNSGHFAPDLPGGAVGMLAGAILLTTLLGAGVPAVHAARKRPVDALREGE